MYGNVWKHANDIGKWRPVSTGAVNTLVADCHVQILAESEHLAYGMLRVNAEIASLIIEALRDTVLFKISCGSVKAGGGISAAHRNIVLGQQGISYKVCVLPVCIGF